MKSNVIVIPSFNPDQKLVDLVKTLIKNELSNILIVNDGSKKECNQIFIEAQQLGCTVIRHAVNLGKGRALKTAFNYLLNKYDEDVMAICADCDGQHLVEDIIDVRDKLYDNEDSIVLGSRQFDDKSIPFRSRFGNKFTRSIFNLFCGIKVSDTQTGLRGLSGKTMKKFLTTKGERYEFEMNMLIEAKDKCVGVTEVPIKTVYIEDNKNSNFNPLKDSLKVYSVFLKFITSSFLSFVVDILLFALLVKLFDNVLDKASTIFLGTLIARLCSSLINYTLNKNTVFNSTGNNSKAIIKYYILCFIQLICSGLLVLLIYSLLPIEESVIKIIVDTVLFIISFKIQREWVFKKR